MTEDVGESKENGQLNAPSLKLVNQFLEVDGLIRIFGRMDRDMAGRVDAKITLSPVPDSIVLDRVLNFPLFDYFHQESPRTKEPGESKREPISLFHLMVSSIICMIPARSSQEKTAARFRFWLE